MVILQIKGKENRLKKMQFSDRDILESLKRYGIDPDDTLTKRGVLAQAKFDIAKIWPVHQDLPLDDLIDLCLKEYPENLWIKKTQNERLGNIKEIILGGNSDI